MSVIDLSDTIIAKSDQLNAADIADSMTIKITKADKKSETDQPVSIFYEGSKNPWKPCKSMRRVIAKLWGSKVDMTGRMITLVCDPSVTWAGQEVGGIRISHMSHIDKKKTVMLRTSKAKVIKYDVLPITDAPVPKKEPAPVDTELFDNAKEAAEDGVESYTEWLSMLTDEEKASIKPHHAELSKIAKAADVEAPVI